MREYTFFPLFFFFLFYAPYARFKEDGRLTTTIPLQTEFKVASLVTVHANEDVRRLLTE